MDWRHKCVQIKTKTYLLLSGFGFGGNSIKIKRRITMSKKEKANKQVIADETIEVPATVTIEGEEVKLETKKSYLKHADRVVRKLDKILTDMVELTSTATTLFEGNSTEIAPKDEARFSELHHVLESTSEILYHVTARMARKYTGTEIEPLQVGRKSLKK
jgi:uncharacterized protein YaaQ